MKHKNDYTQHKYCKCGKLICNKAKHCLSCATKLNSKIKWNLKLRLKVSGKNHWNWKGGITKLNRLVKKLIFYKLWRKQIFKRDNYKCLLCHKRGYLMPHHIIPFAHIIKLYNIKKIKEAIDCKLLWDINWGVTLCKSCHKKMHKSC